MVPAEAYPLAACHSRGDCRGHDNTLARDGFQPLVLPVPRQEFGLDSPEPWLQVERLLHQRCLSSACQRWYDGR
jgi:hypothetical protein